MIIDAKIGNHYYITSVYPGLCTCKDVVTKDSAGNTHVEKIRCYRHRKELKNGRTKSSRKNR